MKVWELCVRRRGVLALVLLAGGSMPAAGADLGEMAAEARRAVGAYAGFLEYGCWIVGALLAAAGMVKLVARDGRPGGGAMLGFGMLFLGLAVAAAMGFAAWPATAKDLGDMAKKGTSALSFFPAFIEYLFWIIGAVLVLAGFYKLKKNTDNPAQQSGMGVVMTIGAGVLMVVFPSAIEMIAGTLDLGTGTTITRPKMQ